MRKHLHAGNGLRLRKGKWRWCRGVGLDHEEGWLLVNGVVIELGPAQADIVAVLFDLGRAHTGEIVQKIYGARSLENERNNVTVMVHALRDKLQGTALNLVNISGAQQGREALYVFAWDQEVDDNAG